MKLNNIVLSASSLEGDKVKNTLGEDLGDIKDIMIDTETGQVQYYVLSFGGFLGMGDKLFAIPPQAISVDTEEKCVVLNVSKEQLENAPGFDKDNWPNMADASFRDQIYGHYGYEYHRGM
jgi:sporulation protein YlmC with PRC-barrel domain